MPPARRRVAALAVSLVAIVAMVGSCGDDSDDSRDGATDLIVTTTTEAADTTTTTEDGEGIAAVEELAQSLLITQQELAVPTFFDAGYTPFEGPNECGVDVDASHPPDVLVGTVLRDDQPRVFQQELRIYETPAAALAAFDARVGATSCGTGDQGTTYGPPTDLAAVLEADHAAEVAATHPQVEGLLITAVVGDAVVSFVFARPTGVSVDDLPDPREVAAFGIGKILAALEG